MTGRERTHIQRISPIIDGFCWYCQQWSPLVPTKDPTSLSLCLYLWILFPGVVVCVSKRLPRLVGFGTTVGFGFFERDPEAIVCIARHICDLRSPRRETLLLPTYEYHSNRTDIIIRAGKTKKETENSYSLLDISRLYDDGYYYYYTNYATPYIRSQRIQHFLVVGVSLLWDPRIGPHHRPVVVAILLLGVNNALWTIPKICS